MGSPRKLIANSVNSLGVMATGEGMEDKVDITPLVKTLYKVSDGRILDSFSVVEEDDLTTATIPVAFPNPGDKVDTVLRKYAKDWVRKQGEYAVDARYQKLKGQSWWDDDGNETRVQGAFILSWWPRPKLTEDEKQELEWRIDLERRRALFSD